MATRKTLVGYIYFPLRACAQEEGGISDLAKEREIPEIYLQLMLSIYMLNSVRSNNISKTPVSKTAKMGINLFNNKNNNNKLQA